MTSLHQTLEDRIDELTKTLTTVEFWLSKSGTRLLLEDFSHDLLLALLSEVENLKAPCTCSFGALCVMNEGYCKALSSVASLIKSVVEKEAGINQEP